jgi:hypothetical protein
MGRLLNSSETGRTETREEIITKWDELGFLDDLESIGKTNISELYDGKASSLLCEVLKPKESWNYLGFDPSIIGRALCDQKCWNQTLVLTINKISRNINGINIIRVDIKLKPLIETLDKYDTETQMLCNKYDIIFESDIGDNMIYAYDSNDYSFGSIEILNYKHD